MNIDEVRIFDAGEDFFDRYTAIIWYNDYTANSMLAFSCNPYSPMGFGQHCNEWEGGDDYVNLGNEITLESLPEDAKHFVMQEINDIKNN